MNISETKKNNLNLLHKKTPFSNLMNSYQKVSFSNESQRDSNEKRIPLFVVHISIDNNLDKSLEVFEGENADIISKEFGVKFGLIYLGLCEESIKILKDNIQKRILNFLTSIQEENY